VPTLTLGDGWICVDGRAVESILKTPGSDSQVLNNSKFAMITLHKKAFIIITTAWIIRLMFKPVSLKF
jgi:hypothetical protein